MIRVASLAAVLFAFTPAIALAADDHVVVSADQLKWNAAPPAFPKGAQLAVITGDPSKEGLYVVRLKVPAGYKVSPHTHPFDENLTVISGTVQVGMGNKIDEKATTAVKTGGFVKMPKGMAHYVVFPEETVLQVHGMGPQGLTYLNPADDPRKSK